MSVRRLADETLQPAGFAFTADNQRWAEAKMAEYPAGRQQSAVIPLLMRAQDQEGWVSRAAIEIVANMLGMAYIRVLEVATFYTQFQLLPVGSEAHIQVCGTTPCMLRGSEALIDACRHHIHHDPHHLSSDGTLSWEEVECLGACVNAPMIAIGRDTYEDLTVERFEEIIQAFRSGKGDTVRPGPQVDRQFSAAMGGETTLLEAPSKTRTRFVPPAAPEAPAPATAAPSAKPAAPAPAAEPEPTKKGRKREITEEAAPAIKEPKGAPKVTEAATETARAAEAVEAKANGAPNRAMREDATGAESPAGKQAAGAAPGKEAGTPAQTGMVPLFDRPDGAPDNLKMISGIGPKLESELHSLGITKFAQVAAFTPEDVSRVEAVLSFKGRIVRDNWTAQAAALAKGGAEEYERVFGKKPR